MAHLPADTVISRPQHSSRTLEVVHNLIVALTVSAIALSLGAAFGVLSGRGAFVGMFSAGIIAFITGCLGGTRVQCSGPVAPMAAVMAVLMATATDQYARNPDFLGGLTPDHYLNLICFMCGGLLLVLAALRTGFLISYVPNAVISGFMTGISLIIWSTQLRTLFGWGGAEALKGDLVLNVGLVVLTIAITVLTPLLLRRFVSVKLSRLIPGPLVAIILVTVLATVLKLDVQLVSLAAKIPDWDGFVTLVQNQIPQQISVKALWVAFPSALEFALICYLDTLMVAMIVDRMTGENSRKNKELMAQGVANAAVGLIGGIPGTQASIRSVLMVKEGASMRLAGAMVGVFVILEMLLLQDVLSMIPSAVFTGILMKVGWDVCDREPIWNYITRKENGPYAHVFWVIIGTAVVTVFNLTLAVLLFTAVSYAWKYFLERERRPKVPTRYFVNRIKRMLGGTTDVKSTVPILPDEVSQEKTE